MIKRLLGIKRYYIVFYTFSVNGKDWGTGYISINNTLGKFFNNKCVVEEVKKNLFYLFDYKYQNIKYLNIYGKQL